MALPINTVLDGKFKVVQILGEGGMGTVYKVEQLGMPPGTPPDYYAVKELLLNPHTSEEERKTAIERFNKEIELLRGLKHRRIASLMFRFQERGNYYFVMEFVPGRTLETVLEDTKGFLSEDDVIQWMMQVCEALSYIHTCNPPIILRDLKPGNIMVTNTNDVQLIDFGIARRFDPSKRTNTENLGTISYASPEHLGSITSPGQRRSAQNPGKPVQTDARSDIYSLGATMYHLLTKYEPDPIQTPAVGSVLAKNPHLRTVQVNGKTVCPIEQVIIKAMQQDPAQRFQSAEAMRVALHQCLPNQAAPATIQIPAISANSTIVVPTNSIISAPTAGGVICPKCGFQNRPGAKFCKRDGQPLVQGIAIAPPQRVSSIPSYPAASATIQSRPVQPPPPLRARPVQSPPPQPIRAHPVQPSATQARSVPPQPIRARPVGSTGNSNDPQVAYRAGLQFLANKNYAEAIARFKQSQSQGNNSYDVLYNLGRTYRQYGQSLHTSDIKQANISMQNAIDYFGQALKLKNDASESHFQMGLCYRDLDLPIEATNAFKKALALTPRDPAIFYQLGLIAREAQSYKEAEKYLQDGLQLNPNHSLILITLGKLYNETNRVPAAIKVLIEATRIDPTNWEGWFELGRAHIKQKEWSYALSALDRARQANSSIIDIYLAIATCYLKQNRKADARQPIEAARQIDPNNNEVIRLQKQL